MSDSGWTQIPNAIMRDTTIPPTTRLLYGVILSYAWGDRGVCTKAAKDLAVEAGIGRSAFFEGVALLRERGLLRVDKRKVGRTFANVYVPLARGVTVTGDGGIEPDAEPDSTGPESGLRQSDAVQEADPTPSATRTQNKTKDEEDQDDAVASSAHMNGSDQGSLGVDVPRRPRLMFNRKVVTVAEWQAVETIVPIFNEIMGTKIGLWDKTATSRIVGVLRSFPEAMGMSAADHRRIITNNAAAPWWNGGQGGKPDTVGVIYSTGAWARASRCDGLPQGRGSQRARTLAVLSAMERGEGRL
jgi:hypothetical protein